MKLLLPKCHTTHWVDDIVHSLLNTAKAGVSRFDILSTTNSPQFVNGRYPKQRVVTYSPKKPKKKSWMKTDENGNEYFDAVEFENDLFITDTFSFGT